MTRKGKGKGSVTLNKVGRPTKFGVLQCDHLDGRQPYYDGRRRDKVSQSAMTNFLDDELFLFFAKFGWDDPMRCVPLVPEPDAETVTSRRNDANEAEKRVVERTASEMDTERDLLVKHVRQASLRCISRTPQDGCLYIVQLMSTRFQANYPDTKRKKTATNKGAPAANIEKLLLTYMARPSLRQLYKVWAKSNPDLEAEVDRRLPEVRKERDDPEYGRIGVWNAVAAEWYGAISEEDKAETMQKAREILKKETQAWKDKLAEPKSMEEAKRYV